MNDFDWDCLQKKRVAQGEKHRKKRSRGCTLPSDYMTAAQKQKLNGGIMMLKLNEPISWDGFLALPDDLKKDYIENLRAKYAATDDRLALLFRKSSSTVTKARVGLGIPGASKKRPTPTQSLEWKQFLARPYQDKNIVVEESDGPKESGLEIARVHVEIVCRTFEDLERAVKFLKNPPDGFTFRLEYGDGN